MRAPSYNIPSVDRRTGLSEYQPVPSQMPPAPAGFQWVAVTGQIFPQLQKISNPNAPLLGLGILAAAGLIFFSMMHGGKSKKFSLPVVPMG